MQINIDTTSTPNIWQLRDQAPTLEIYADQQFDNAQGGTVLAGSVARGDCCKRVLGSVANNTLTFPTIVAIDTTEDSPTNQGATYSAYIRARGQDPIPWLLNFPLEPIVRQGVTSRSWTDIRQHAALPRRT
jgi:hypothetical protein